MPSHEARLLIVLSFVAVACGPADRATADVDAALPTDAPRPLIEVDAAPLIGAPPSGYRMSREPQCGVWCYFDEVHNEAINGVGQSTQNLGFDEFAFGQLIDGVRGGDAWDVDLGQGIAYEWVGWLGIRVELVFEFDASRAFGAISIGLNNAGNGAVVAPDEVLVEFGDDGVTFGNQRLFRATDNNIEPVPAGERGDVVLNLGGAYTGRFVRLVLDKPDAWTFIDEIDFNATVTDQTPPIL